MFYEGDDKMYAGSGGDRSGYGLWIGFAFIVFVIFAVMAFAMMRDTRRHDGGYAETLAPIIAAKAVDCDGGHGKCNPYIWDNTRDSLKEFGEIKKEIAVTALGQSRDTDNKFHEVLRKQCEDTATIMAAMNDKFYQLSKENWEKERDMYRDKLLYKEINTPKQMFGYSPPMPIQTPPMSCSYMADCA